MGYDLSMGNSPRIVIIYDIFATLMVDMYIGGH